MLLYRIIIKNILYSVAIGSEITTVYGLALIAKGYAKE